MPQWGRRPSAGFTRQVSCRHAGGVDVHQHLWPPELVDALRSRNTAPRLDGWTLHLAGEPPYDVDPTRARARSAAPASTPTSGASSLGLSSPLGIEDLRPDDAEPLLLAWHKGVLSLPEPFAPGPRSATSIPDLAGLQRRCSTRGSSACRCPRPGWPRRRPWRRSRSCCGSASSRAGRCSSTPGR